ncbi:MAG: RluA family pseudouridine synthase [Blastocatellia bacterium]
MIRRIELQVHGEGRRKRLEDFLFDHFSSLSKMYLREVVKNEKCEVNGRFENVGYRLRTNDFIEIELDPSRENSMVQQDIALDVVFEDDDIIVIKKPAGMLVHPSHRDKTGTLLNALTYYLNRAEPTTLTGGGALDAESTLESTQSRSPANACGSELFIRPGLVHRLDKQTSGLIVVAKNSRAHRILSAHFQRKLVEKRYLALVDGIVSEDEGTIIGEIGRYAEEKRWGLKADGKHAETRFYVRERHDETTLLELEPVTGRTNQLRIHCASIGHPIVGDIKRGGSESERLCLHAYKLSFRHPSTGELIQFESSVSFK